MQDTRRIHVQRDENAIIIVQPYRLRVRRRETEGVAIHVAPKHARAEDTLPPLLVHPGCPRRRHALLFAPRRRVVESACVTSRVGG